MPQKNTTAGRKAAGISATETLAAASSLPQATTWAHLTRKENLLALAIFIDLLAVAMVVPLLPQRMAELGVDTATIGYIKSVYSASQIVGGVLLAVVSDRGLLSRRGVLILSFAGAALSYTIVGFANSVPLLLFSRVVVGLVKQTMTTSSTMVAECTTSKDRAAAMGRLGTAMTLGWMSGQALGGVLASRVHMSAPPAVAVLLYAVDTVFVLLFISGPPNIASPTTSTTSTSVSASSSATSGNVTTKPRAQGTMALLRSVLQDRGTAKVLAVQAAYDVVTYGLYAMMQQYEKDRYRFTPEQLGFLGSARAAVGVLIQGFLVGAIISRIGETAALRIGLLTAVLTHGVEWYLVSAGGGTSWLMYAAVFMPLRALASYITSIGLKSLLTTMPPESAQGTALAAIDVVHSATGVVGPTIGGIILAHVGVTAYPLVAAAGYAVVCLLLILLFGVKPQRGSGGVGVKIE